MGLNPDESWFEISFGNVNAEPLPVNGAGAVTITDPTHPMITGNNLGASPLGAEDLDPFGTGGRGVITNPPSGSIIASNAAGCMLADYQHGAGNVFLSATLREQPTCRNNVLLYVESLVQ